MSGVPAGGERGQRLSRIVGLEFIRGPRAARYFVRWMGRPKESHKRVKNPLHVVILLKFVDEL